MNIQRFSAPTAREALALARAVFGDATLVLSNRQLPNGVEISAAAEDDLSSLAAAPAPHDERPLLIRAAAASGAAPAPARSSHNESDNVSAATTHDTVQADTEQLAMSTLSFQDYVRERMLRRQQEESSQAPAYEPPRLSTTPKPSAPRVADAAAAPAARPVAIPASPLAEPAVAAAAAAAVAKQPAPAQRGADSGEGFAKGVMHELNAMKQLMEERFNTLAWLGQARLDPVHSQLMLKLVRAGYSAALARAVLSPIAPGCDVDSTFRTVMASLECMLAVDPAMPSLVDEGGTFALVGATGVGKTTTICKLAVQCARLHGTASVGLVTLDTQRAGAHEQLRAFGRSVGIVAHLAHDRDELQELLALLSAKHLVLIDTPGVSPRDPRRHELQQLLDLPTVRRVLVLNAGAHGDTLDEMARACPPGAAGAQAILSKLDEAVKLGPALDTLMRHRLVLRGIANGQRVPEDWRAPNGSELVRDSMRADRRSPFDPASADLDFYFSPAACAI